MKASLAMFRFEQFRIAMAATLLLIAFCTASSPASGQDKPLTQADFYQTDTFTIPTDVVLEAGDIELMPDGKLAVSSRRGDIYMIDKPFAESIADAKFKLYAQGLHEVLGLAAKDGWLYATQRCEVTRLKDITNNGRADLLESVSDGWGITGDYHEYAFGSKFDKDNNLWVVLCLTGSFTSQTKYRGWCLRITRDGKTIPTCSGIRSPGGIGSNHLGDVFYTDNQGPWNGTCSLKHLAPGSFQGHPGGNQWYNQTDAIGLRPQDPQSGSRTMVEAKKIPELMPPAVLFPYKKMGQSASGIACDTTGGKFGPFKNQLFVGDQTFSTVMRVQLEKVNGRYQGACFPFLSGFASGSLSVQMTDNGTLFVGGTNRGWGSRGNKPFSLQRVTWNGKIPFEVLEMNAKPDGFELKFTQPVDPKTAGDIASYKLTTYTYIYQAAYGSPEVDHTTPTIENVKVAKDGLSARLTVKGLQAGHVHELHMPGVRSDASIPLLHNVAYYTMNYIPGDK